MDLRSERVEIEPLDETVDDPQLDSRAAFEFLGQNHDADQRIAGADVDLLQPVGEFEDFRDGDAPADHAARDGFALGRQFGKLAVDIEAGQRECQALGLCGNGRTRRHLRNGNVPGRYRQRDFRRLDLARCRRALPPCGGAQQQRGRSRAKPDQT